MNSDMILTFVILGITIAVFIWDKLRVDIVALLSMLALVLTGIISTGEGLAGFSDSTVIMIAGLFVVGAGLFRTGVADWLGDQLLRLAGSSELRLMIVLMLGTALLSGFMSNTGTVAVLLPAVVAAAWRIGSVPSKLLMPMSFAASIGGMLTLIGTPPNIVISNALRDAGFRQFNFFEFSLIGLPLLAIGVVYMVYVGRRWLPEHKPKDRSAETSISPEELAKAYKFGENLFQLRVRRRSSLAGHTIGEKFAGHHYGVTILRIQRAANEEPRKRTLPRPQALDAIADTFSRRDGGTTIPTPDSSTQIQANDVLIVEGAPEAVHRLAVSLDLGIQPQESLEAQPEDYLLSNEVGVAEVLISPRSELIGQSIVDARFGEKYGVRVLAISRRGKPLADVNVTSVKLDFGDSLLVRGTWDHIGLLQNESRNFVVVGRPSEMTQLGGLSPRAFIALGAMAAMLLMMLTGVVSNVIAVLIAALAMVLSGCLNMEQAYRAVNWESVILIAAMLPMKTALEVTGGADFIAAGLVNTLGAIGPLALMAGIFILTAGFTQVISNTATTVLVAPIAIESAVTLGISVHPVMMMVAVAASSAFLTPIASPVNTMVMTPGSYNFGDFMKSGLPLVVLFLVVSLVLVPLIWSL